LGELSDRDLADNTIHGFFEVSAHSRAGPIGRATRWTLGCFASVGPRVAQKEVETNTQQQLERVLAATAPGWPTIAIKILLGTGMRLSELCGLIVEDFEDDGERAFLMVRHGKGVKFRGLPVSSRFRRDLIQYRQPLAAGVAPQRRAPAVRQPARPRRDHGRALPADPSEGRVGVRAHRSDTRSQPSTCAVAARSSDTGGSWATLPTSWS